MSLIHARRRNGAIVYRVWGSICDAYLTPEMTETELREYLLDDYSPREREYGVPEREIPERIGRANRKGTSSKSPDNVEDLDGPWETERCDGCGGFHHAFVAGSDGKCTICGGKPEHGHGCV